MRLVILSSISVLLPFVVSSQTLVSASSVLNDNGKAAYRVTVAFTPAPIPKTPVTGAPYSADEEFEAIQPDGSSVPHGQPTRSHARDAQGRTRLERSLYLGPNMPETPRLVEIADVVSGFSYTLDPQNRIAHRVRSQTPGGVPTAPSTEAAAGPSVATAEPGGGVTVASSSELRPQPVPAVAVRPGAPTPSRGDALPSRLIEGLTVDGTRSTLVLPGIEPGGSTRVATSEVWTSRDLGIVLVTHVVDASNGQHNSAMKNISRAEPAPELFTVPPGYTIRDEPGRFTIELTLQD